MLTTRTGECYEVLLHAFVPLLPYCLMDAPQPCGVICPHCLTPLLPALLLTLLTVTREWFTTQRALDLALSVSVLGTMGSWLYSGLLVGRTEEQNKIPWGSQPAELVGGEGCVCILCPSWPVSQPSGRFHCGLFLEDSLSPGFSCTSGLLLSSAF